MFKTIASQLVCRATGLALSLTAGSFPRTIRVECTNACNASCIICPHRHMKRPVSFISDKLYERIILECASNHCQEIHLHNFGEPLLDPNLEQRVRFAKEVGIGKVKIFSNGSLLTEEKSRGLIKAGLDEIVISIDGASAKEFEQVRSPLKFDTVVANLSALIRLRDDAQSGLKIKVACCSTGNAIDTQSLLPQKGIDKFSFGKIHNWGTEGESTRSGIRKPCSRVWRTFTILADGKAALCCLDYEGRVILGDLNSGQTIREIFNGEPHRRACRLHAGARQHEIAICSGCSKSFI